MLQLLRNGSCACTASTGRADHIKIMFIFWGGYVIFLYNNQLNTR